MSVPPSRLRLTPFALGTIGLGFVGLVFRDFALQWQPVPQGISLYTPLAIMSAALLVSLGALLFPEKTRSIAARAFVVVFAFWALALHAPRVAMAPADISTWLGLCEIGALTAGALAIAGEHRASAPMLLIARQSLGVCALVFGLSHFLYPRFVAGMIPGWIPVPIAWAYATGAGHMLAGIALVTGIRSRLASVGLAAMCGAFVILLHAPRVIAAPTSHAEWTMLFIALSIAGAALATAAAPERERMPFVPIRTAA
jgi:uncharacterized membrane protein YphA (DoxX/SURF4 family)